MQQNIIELVNKGWIHRCSKTLLHPTLKKYKVGFESGAGSVPLFFMVFCFGIMRLSDLSDTLTADIQDLLNSAGYTLVRAKKMGSQRHPTLQIMMDRTDGAPITVEDCEAVNRLLDPLFSVHDPWPEAYQLEVSSPGLDRPLILPQDFVRFVGQRVKVRLSPPIEGRRKLEGVLDAETTPQIIVIRLDDHTLWRVPYDVLQEARIVITDAMIAEEMKKRGAA